MDEPIAQITLLEHEITVERKCRTIRRLITGWAASIVVLAGLIGWVIAYV